MSVMGPGIRKAHLNLLLSPSLLSVLGSFFSPQAASVSRAATVSTMARMRFTFFIVLLPFVFLFDKALQLYALNEFW